MRPEPVAVLDDQPYLRAHPVEREGERDSLEPLVFERATKQLDDVVQAAGAQH